MPTPGWERFEAFLWRTSSLLVVGESESLVVDPAISADEVAGIDRRALELGAPVGHVLITHGDWDHVCGIGGFPDAVVAMGEETAEKVEDGSRVQSIQRAVEAYGFVSSGSPRVDETFARGRAVALGEFVVETFPLVGHTPDGTGFRLRELGLLVVGDYLSPVEFPFATSPVAYRLTLDGLIELLARTRPRRWFRPRSTAYSRGGSRHRGGRSSLPPLPSRSRRRRAGPGRNTRRGARSRLGRSPATRVRARPRGDARLQRRPANRGDRPRVVRLVRHRVGARTRPFPRCAHERTRVPRPR